jgi:DHA2 family multidrug resistance protein
MRNLGGAIGIALLDSVIYGRAPVHSAALVERLKAGDVGAARIVGIPLDKFLAGVGKPIDADTKAILEPLVESAALTQAINEAWALAAILTALALLTLPFLKRVPPEATLHAPPPADQPPEPASLEAGR